VACGAVPEVIEDGVTGRIVDTEDAAVAAVADVAGLDRRRIRHVFERRFTPKSWRALRRPLPKAAPAANADQLAYGLSMEPIASNTLSTTYVLKDGDSFIVADAAGDIEGGSDGFFHNDTRLLSRFICAWANRSPRC
jgi:hypothetical protein